MKKGDFEKYWEFYYPETKDQLNTFLNFIKDSYLFGYNVIIDYLFLNNTLKENGLEELQQNKLRCLYRLSNTIIKNKNINIHNHKLETVCKHFEIIGSNGLFHSAIFDAMMTAKLFILFLKNIYKTIEISSVNNKKKTKKTNYML